VIVPGVLAVAYPCTTLSRQIVGDKDDGIPLPQMIGV
jgi:hypothetical protein